MLCKRAQSNGFLVPISWNRSQYLGQFFLRVANAQALTYCRQQVQATAFSSVFDARGPVARSSIHQIFLDRFACVGEPTCPPDSNTGLAKRRENFLQFTAGHASGMHKAWRPTQALRGGRTRGDVQGEDFVATYFTSMLILEWGGIRIDQVAVSHSLTTSCIISVLTRCTCGGGPHLETPLCLMAQHRTNGDQKSKLHIGNRDLKRALIPGNW